MHERPNLVEQVGFDLHQPIDFRPTIGEAAQEHRNVVIGLLGRLAARP